jgi:UDP-N-acetylmuramate: L-alanyl-gamma-D-glutamyl-meso-diaminopimelate ligase
LNNLEFDHADIFPDLAAIQTQFHHLVRTVPGQGRLIVNGEDPHLETVLAKGAWTPVDTFAEVGKGQEVHQELTWALESLPNDGFKVIHLGQPVAEVHWDKDAYVAGRHNQLNALAAIAAAHHVGVSVTNAAKALGTFKNVKRRMELVGMVRDISVYDDFAHHPTAITTTVDGLRRRIGRARLIAVLEPRSNTMKLGVMKTQLPDSLKDADLVFGYGALEGKDALGWDLAESLKPLGEKAYAFNQIDQLVKAVVEKAQPGDHILVMSNGGFGGVHQKLLKALA